MFETLVSKPVFNLLTFIYAYLPGHNLGLAIIVFTLTIRMLLWPLLKKQLHSSRAIRELQPELRRIKKETKGDRARESQLTMELYKERGINPFSSLGTAVLQLPILLALFSGIKKIIADPMKIVSYSYPFIQHTPWMVGLVTNIDKLDKTLFGIVDLTRRPLVGSIFHPSTATFYIPGIIIALLSAVVQYYSSKMLMVTDQEARGLRQILREASGGTEADQAEVNAATMRMMRYLIPFMILITTINFACALGLYWFVSGLIQYLQQIYILGRDKEELGVATATVGSDSSVIEAEVIPPRKPKPTPKKASKKKRRR
jgi:YidC/Oxa1 family membrane protein insertase